MRPFLKKFAIPGLVLTIVLLLAFQNCGPSFQTLDNTIESPSLLTSDTPDTILPPVMDPPMNEQQEDPKEEIPPVVNKRDAYSPAIEAESADTIATLDGADPQAIVYSGTPTSVG